jgi:hypothetical protein
MGIRLKLSDKVIKEIVDARKGGMTIQQVAVALGLSSMTVRKYSPPELRLTRVKYDYTFKQNVLAYLAEGHTVGQASALFKASGGTIKSWLQDARREGKFPVSSRAHRDGKHVVKLTNVQLNGDKPPGREGTALRIAVLPPSPEPRPKMALVDFIACLRELVTEYDRTKTELIRLKAEVEVWQKLKAQSDDALMNVGRR